MAATVKTIAAENINEYISAFPKETQGALKLVRTTIKKAVPGLEETISYAIPAFKHHGKTLVYFAGYKNHVGLYPVPVNNPMFEKDFAAYKTSGKGAIQFPLNAPMPKTLISKIVQYIMQEHVKRIQQEKKKKKITFQGSETL